MEAHHYQNTKRQRVADVAVTTAIDRWRRHDTGRTLGRSSSDVWHGLYADAGFDLDAPLVVTAAIVGTLYLGKPEGSRAAEDAGRSALRTLLREGLLHVTSRKGGTWNVTLRDPRVALRARGVVRPDPQLVFDDFDREDVDDALEHHDADRGVVSLCRAQPPPDDPPDREIARENTREKGEKLHAFSHPVDPRSKSNNQDSRLSVRPSVEPHSAPTRTSASASEDLRARENTRDFSPRYDRGRLGDLSRSAPPPAGIGESLADAGGVLAAIADPIASAKRRHKVITDTIRFVRQRIDDPKLREMPIVRWGQAIADGRIGHDVLSRILIRLDGMRARGELDCPPWVYFVCASKRAFRERGLEWPEPFAKR